MSNFKNIGGVPVMGFISPVFEGDEYAVTDPLYAVGGFRVIEGGVSDLNNIPSLRRRAGMVVGVNKGSSYYKLLDKVWDYDSSDWVEWSLSNGGFDDDFGNTDINGVKLFNNRLMQVTTELNTINVTLNDNNIIVNLKCVEDYNIILPPLLSVPLGFKITFKNLKDSNLMGSIITYSTDVLEGEQTFNFFGRGVFEVTKMSSISGDEFEWVLTMYSNIVEHRNQGKTKRVDFQNKKVVVVDHDLNYIPVVQVWSDNGLGDYTDVDVLVKHDFESKKSFTIDFDSNISGFILFI